MLCHKTQKTARLNPRMEVDLTPEQLSLQQATIEFARAELSSGMIERDAERVFSHEGWKKCAAFGVHGLPIPEEFGGSGSDPVTTTADRKSTRLNSSHVKISYAVFCLKKKKQKKINKYV